MGPSSSPSPAFAQRLRRENEELMAHLPEIIDNIPDGVLTQSPENPVLVYGNPYSANPAIPETDLVSMRKCPMCNEVFPNDIGEQHYSDHVQSHLLECPYCDKSFDKSNKQVYDDHVFCHGLRLSFYVLSSATTDSASFSPFYPFILFYVTETGTE
ncbi:calcium-binding and coiled-coil domain-containing protein 2-like [Rhineura floridana]|uniref:calcium-binding and coiled-coil domain-containing protein 2-like n=1 Tax=Rhineura floridana TaxID=261503 RepID=UPI002AC809DB|nr:calcium-binding and coiled-coil domain-containing protein 2-like [Rhineura floridana]